MVRKKMLSHGSYIIKIKHPQVKSVPQKNSKEQERFLAFLSHEQNSSNGVHNVDGPSEMLMEF